MGKNEYVHIGNINLCFLVTLPGKLQGIVITKQERRISMKRLKSFTMLGLSLALITGLLTGCGTSNEKDTELAAEKPSEAVSTNDQDAEKNETEKSDTEQNDAQGGKVYYLNFKPEVADIWEEIMNTYTDETGVEATVMTAAAGTYEQTLKSEIAKTEAPTLFQVSPVGLDTWKEYCLDLKDTEMYKHLSNKNQVLSSGETVYAVPYAVEGYGIIYNNKILSDYCSMDGAKIKSAEDINSFEKLKEVAEDIQAKKEELGIKGAFAATGMAPGDDWRWHTHLMNMPIYYEYKEKGITDTKELSGTYLDNYKQILDLYLNNSTVEPEMLSSIGTGDSMSEFALGEVAFVQNGDWAWNDIKDNEVAEEDVKFLPIYIGAEGEENQGLCVGTEAFWCVNSKASKADQKATLDFVNWLLTSEKGKDYVINQLNFTSPFDTFQANEAPSNPLSKQIMEYAKSGKESVNWAFSTMPGDAYKKNLGAAILEYTQGTSDWSGVKKALADEWAKEKANSTAEESK